MRFLSCTHVWCSTLPCICHSVEVPSSEIYMCPCCMALFLVGLLVLSISCLNSSWIGNCSPYSRLFSCTANVCVGLSLPELSVFLPDRHARCLYLIQALISSVADPDYNYERLEFIGDTVLKFLCGAHLYLEFLDISVRE